MNQELYKYSIGQTVEHNEYLQQLCDEIGVRFKTNVQIDTSNWFATHEVEYYIESNNKNKLYYVMFEYNKYTASYNYAKKLEDEILKKDNKPNHNVDAHNYYYVKAIDLTLVDKYGIIQKQDNDIVKVNDNNSGVYIKHIINHGYKIKYSGNKYRKLLSSYSGWINKEKESIKNKINNLLWGFNL